MATQNPGVYDNTVPSVDVVTNLILIVTYQLSLPVIDSFFPANLYLSRPTSSFIFLDPIQVSFRSHLHVCAATSSKATPPDPILLAVCSANHSVSNLPPERAF
jgi:hypothetical protein